MTSTTQLFWPQDMPHDVIEEIIQACIDQTERERHRTLALLACISSAFYICARRRLWKTVTLRYNPYDNHSSLRNYAFYHLIRQNTPLRNDILHLQVKLVGDAKLSTHSLHGTPFDLALSRSLCLLSTTSRVQSLTIINEIIKSPLTTGGGVSLMESVGDHTLFGLVAIRTTPSLTRFALEKIDNIPPALMFGDPAIDTILEASIANIRCLPPIGPKKEDEFRDFTLPPDSPFLALPPDAYNTVARAISYFRQFPEPSSAPIDNIQDKSSPSASSHSPASNVDFRPAPLFPRLKSLDVNLHQEPSASMIGYIISQPSGDSSKPAAGHLPALETLSVQPALEKPEPSTGAEIKQLRAVSPLIKHLRLIWLPDLPDPLCGALSSSIRFDRLTTLTLLATTTSANPEEKHLRSLLQTLNVISTSHWPLLDTIDITLIIHAGSVETYRNLFEHFGLMRVLDGVFSGKVAPALQLSPRRIGVKVSLVRFCSTVTSASGASVWKKCLESVVEDKVAREEGLGEVDKVLPKSNACFTLDVALRLLLVDRFTI